MKAKLLHRIERQIFSNNIKDYHLTNKYKQRNLKKISVKKIRIEIVIYSA
jgi:hypothetical protein